MAVNEIAVTVASTAVEVTVTPTPIEIDNNVYLSVSSGNNIDVSVGTGTDIVVAATRVGPPGTGLGMLLHDYAVQGQLPDWEGAVVANLDLGNVIQPNLTGDVTSVTFTGWPPAGTEGKMVLYIPQGGSLYTISGWAAGVKWLGGITPVLTDQNAHVDVFVFTSVDSGTNIYGFHVGTAA